MSNLNTNTNLDGSTVTKLTNESFINPEVSIITVTKHAASAPVNAAPPLVKGSPETVSNSDTLSVRTLDVPVEELIVKLVFSDYSDMRDGLTLNPVPLASSLPIPLPDSESVPLCMETGPSMKRKTINPSFRTFYK